MNLENFFTNVTLNASLIQILFHSLNLGESSKTKTDDRVIVAFQENDIANPFIIIPVGNSLESVSLERILETVVNFLW